MRPLGGVWGGTKPHVRWERQAPMEVAPEVLLRCFSTRIQQLAERARATVRLAVPGAVEEVKPNRGYFGYRLQHHFAFVQPLQDYVRLGFAFGASLEDPAGLLLAEPSRRLRYVRLDRPVDARRVELTTLLQLAAATAPPRRVPPPGGARRHRRGGAR